MGHSLARARNNVLTTIYAQPLEGYRLIGVIFTGQPDRPGTLRLPEVPGYPAHLKIEYPERLSRGLVLVTCWPRL